MDDLTTIDDVPNPGDVLSGEAIAEMAAAMEAEESQPSQPSLPSATPDERAIRFAIVPEGRGYRGVVIIPLTDGKRAVKATAKGVDKATALGRAASIAKAVEDNEVLKALLPPQATAALKATTALAKAAKLGKLDDVAKRFTGPAIKRLSSLFGGK